MPETKLPSISVERLDALFDSTMSDNAGKVVFIFGALRLLCVFAYLYCRARLVDQTWLPEKQRYEQERTVAARAAVERDES